MARGNGWWGTGPLVVGASGLVLLAFGAKWLPADDEANDAARQEAAKIVEGVRDGDPAARQAAKEILNRPGRASAGADADADPATRLRDALYEKLTYRDPRAVVAGRIAFYGGLVLVFAAGVLLYRRTPESNQGSW